MTIINVAYRGKKLYGYTLNTETNQIFGKTGKPLKYQRNGEYVFVGGKFAKLENVIKDSLTYEAFLNNVGGETEDSNEPVKTKKEVTPKNNEVSEDIEETPESTDESKDITPSVVGSEEIKDWVSMNLLRAEAMQILDQADDVTYWGFQETARNHIIYNEIIDADEHDIMVELVIINYIEPRLAVKGCKMKREYEWMTFEEIAKDLGIPVNTNYAEALKEYWINVIRKTYIDQIKYRRGYFSINKFGTMICPVNDFREVIGAWTLFVALCDDRRLMY